MNRYLTQVLSIKDEWMSIAGDITRQPINDAWLGDHGVARGERYRVLDVATGQTIAQGTR